MLSLSRNKERLERQATRLVVAKARELGDILNDELGKLDVDFGIKVLETGTIRDATTNGRQGDGWSTLFFAQHPKVSRVVSIDLVTATADKVLTRHRVRDRVELVTGYSIEELANRLAIGDDQYDVVFLDSDNDAKLILHEFMIAKQLVAKNGIIIIDDVATPATTPGALKGELVLPYIENAGLSHRVMFRRGWSGYTTGVLVVEPFA